MGLGLGDGVPLPSVELGVGDSLEEGDGEGFEPLLPKSLVVVEPDPPHAESNTELNPITEVAVII